MAHVPGTLHARLHDSTEQAWRLYCALELVIPHRDNSRDQVRIHPQRLVASTIPWHSTAAGLTMELHAEVRRLEVHLKELVSGAFSPRRGGSQDNTHYALKALTNLAEAVDDQTTVGILNTLDRWIRKADAVFEPQKGLHRVPREPGEKEMRCPYCTFQTMRWHPATGVIVCVHPECLNEAGIRPRWIAEFIIKDDELQFSWEAIGEAA